MKERGLYPEIVFHFCQKEAILGILSSTFRVSYAREKIIGKSGVREIGVPMVSFCDLRVSEVGSHMGKYGNYGIGLTKEWANRKGLNPVLYISQHSPFTDGLLSGLDSIHAHIRQLKTSGDSQRLSTIYMNIFNTYRFVKNYEAPLQREGQQKLDNYRFADEREWRYVPSLESTDLQPFLPLEAIRTKSKKKN
ncbi:hypothetical protein AYI74_12985 [Shewanella algae]|uniref:abortive infection system antitoxin AbiGi family protein n=1 Tax=Shewanella algae TaxID=38313 RepID=UPI0011B69EBC|nr:abortive infection system antitoxin AbiGi family protein [Shewanella algae]TWU67840.1 hypothetical protein AYI74_12985 [Shewanella algae]